jgi:hypothetical protein
MNAFHEVVPFSLPDDGTSCRWQLLFDTARPEAAGSHHDAGRRYPLEPRSTVVMIRPAALTAAADAKVRADAPGTLTAAGAARPRGE